MISDCLAPLISYEGVGTIVTLNDRAVLCDGLKFCAIGVESFQSESGDQYHIEIQKAKTTGRSLFVTSDVCMLSPNGWVDLETLNRPSKSKLTPIRVLEYQCISCGAWYLPSKPYLTFCSQACLRQNLNTASLRYRNANAKTVADGLIREAWTESFNIRNSRIECDVEAVEINRIDNATGVYVNGILISSKKLLNLA